ncbi:hypothetical protein RHMOL_Rhmol05G0169900 [Rhododendron molle]|uniref:Uncharacterized protein n=1 Tax=Rhododendron molle TaxID=49168 RepID=A0ACC0NS54_RHOML|nr:hypothetical protein RHMOL_Rhmol05G0169900 [Rhododendron molle]
MDGIIYHSFLRYNEEGVSNAWHLNYIGPADSAQALPNDLRNYFPGGGVSTWILIRHGFRVWPIEVVNFQFGEGLDTFSETYNLKFGIKITMPCQQKWIFHTAIFDESDQELVYRWASPNLQWREFHDPPVNLRTACFPFTFGKELTMLKFGFSIDLMMFTGHFRLEQSLAGLKWEDFCRSGVFYDKVSNVTIWENHSTTQVPDFLNARINGLPIKGVINNVNWSEEEFTKKVQKVRSAKFWVTM